MAKMQKKAKGTKKTAAAKRKLKTYFLLDQKQRKLLKVEVSMFLLTL